MSHNKIYKSGSTSTFIPGGTGSSGTRAGVTFYGSKSQSVQTSDTITFSLNNENVTIDNQYGESIIPATYDFIVYADDNITYLLSIVEVSNNICYTSIIDSWNTQSQSSDSQKTNVSDIALNIDCNVADYQEYIGYKKYISTSVLSNTNNLETAEYTGTNDIDMLKMHSSCAFTFTISSLNDNTIGNYKIILEFITDWSSPAMDTRIAKKFQEPGQYCNIPEYDSSTQYKTFRGYFSNYSCKGIENQNAYSNTCSSCGSHNLIFTSSEGKIISHCLLCGNEVILDNINPKNASENFDDEKLDNFVVTIKDYDQGVRSMSYKSTIYIPKDVIINAINANHPYSCNMYIYVDGTNGTKEKVWMRDLSSFVNIKVKNSDSSIYDDYEHEEPPYIPDDARYPGTGKSGDDIILLNNPSEVENNNPLLGQEVGNNVKSTSYEDDVYVNNMRNQNTGGTDNWCECFYNRFTNKITYTATSDNPSNVNIRRAYFVHTTDDLILARGPHAGDFAMSQWTVIVEQSPKLLPKASYDAETGLVVRDDPSTGDLEHP